MNLVVETLPLDGLGEREGEMEAGKPTMAALAAGIAGRVPKERFSWAYGMALGLGVFTMLGIPGVYAGLLVYLATALVRSADDWLAWVQGGASGAMEAGWRTAVFLGGLGLGVAVLGCLLRPFFVKPSGRGQRLALSPAMEPKLFGFIQLICDALGVPRPDRVEVDCRMNASAGLRRGPGSLFSDAWVLTLGLPMVAGLGVTEFSGILAHELGHLGQGWAFRAFHVVRRMGEWLEAAAGRAGSEEVWGSWSLESDGRIHQWVVGSLRLGVWFSEAVIGGLRVVCLMVNHSLLRQMELRADRVQIEWVGSETFEATFRRLCVLAGVQREVYRDLRRRWMAGEFLPENLPEAWVGRADGISEETAEGYCARRLERERDAWDAHPSDGSRLDRARSMARAGVFRCEGRASGLFSHFAALATQVTALHYGEDLRWKRRGGRGGE